MDTTEAALPPAPRFVYVTCYDRPFRLIELELAILEPFLTHLYCKIKHDAPELDQHGRRFWRSGMREAVFATYVTSLRLQKLTLGAGVTLGEILNVFAYEGLHLHTGFDAPPSFETLKAFTSESLAFPTEKDESVHEYLTLLAEQIATTIVCWPRLKETLRAAKAGGAVVAHRNLSASPTRCWVGFDVKPITEKLNRGDSVLKLCEKNPPWLARMLLHIGVVRAALIRRGLLVDQSDVAHFKTLQREIHNHALGPLFGLLEDTPKYAYSGNQSADYFLAQRFAFNWRSTVLAAAQEPDLQKVQFARAIVTFANDLILNSPAYSTLFSADCVDKTGASPERTLLTNALRERRVEVVRWSGGSAEAIPDLRPLPFPGYSEGESRVAVLLDFSKLL